MSMLKSVAVVVGSYLLSIVLVIATDPLLSRLFPGDFVRGHIPSQSALLASTAFFVIVSVLCAAVCARFAPTNAARAICRGALIAPVIVKISTEIATVSGVTLTMVHSA